MKALARVLAATLAALPCAAADPTPDALAGGFANPPTDSRPLVFWQWVNGNVSREGIRLDLEWMQRIGLAGALMFDIGFRTPPVPQYVERRVGFGTDEWRDAVAYASSEARRLKLLLGAQSSGGWSVSGGPEVAPESAMKKLVWSETMVTPRTPRDLRLPAPPSVSGPYQDIPIANPDHRQPQRYADVAVIAYRLPDAEQHSPPRPAALSVGGVPIPGATLLHDGRYADGIRFSPVRGEVVIDARMHFQPRSLTLGVVNRPAIPRHVVETSTDGVHFQSAAPELTDVQATPVVTLAIDAGRKFWRVRFMDLEQPIDVTEVRFESAARVHLPQSKAGFGVPRAADTSAEAGARASVAVDPRRVLDLSARMSADGSLNWRPDKGRWTVLRFGWSLTGRRTVPATVESIGLEVDKLDGAAVRKFADDFFDRFGHADSRVALDMAITDSWEAGQQNWTARMFEEFERRRGYDLRPWMPVLAGRLVGDRNASEKLLTDFRRTIADLVADHYSAIAEVTHGRGMTYFSQAAGTDQPTLVDGLQAKGRVDVPTGEFWYWAEEDQPAAAHLDDVREAASAAHIHGKPFVAVESLTTRGEAAWAQGPAQWRRMVDRFFAEGMNRVILHTSVHQPFTDRRPGMTLRQFGQHFTRNETWAEDAGAWVDYLARTSWLLQQGQHVADFAVLRAFGEYGSPPRSGGHDFDLVDEEMLQRFTFDAGRLWLPGGASYHALVAPASRDRLDARSREKLRELEALGARIVARSTPLSLPGIEPDVTIDGNSPLHWTHRATPEADIYFLTNQSPRPFEGDLRFRVGNRHAEIWDAESGARAAANYSGGVDTTSVRLALEPWSSRFLVFRGKPTNDPSWTTVRVPLLRLNEGWNVRFIDAGIPDEPRFAAGSWTRHDSPAIRFHSGQAIYSRSVQVPASRLAGGHRVELDLGNVGDLARVQVNDRDFGVWWSAPFRRDITDALRPGENRLKITVTNYWANRLIGDEQPGATPTTFTPIRPYQADSPLRPAGLLGPVQLLSLAPGKSP